MKKSVKPRKKDGIISFDMVVREGNTPIFRVENRFIKDLKEVVDMLNKKL